MSSKLLAELIEELIVEIKAMREDMKATGPIQTLSGTTKKPPSKARSTDGIVARMAKGKQG